VIAAAAERIVAPPPTRYGVAVDVAVVARCGRRRDTAAAVVVDRHQHCSDRRGFGCWFVGAVVEALVAVVVV